MPAVVCKFKQERHSFICSLLGIKHVLVAVNKMDLIDYDQEQYQAIKKEYREFAESLSLRRYSFCSYFST